MENLKSFQNVVSIKKNKCRETRDISKLVKVEDTIAAGMEFFSLSEKQRRNIVENFDNFMQLLDGLSEMTEAKDRKELEVYEYSGIKDLSTETEYQTQKNSMNRDRSEDDNISMLKLPTAKSILENSITSKILGKSHKIISVKREVIKIAPSNSTVLIRGESGTGKELVARAIHMGSPRAEKPFVAINCAAIPENLLESELFGYEKGAFTGADSKGRIGKVEIANGGTLFLDEIGDMPISLQAKLLRVLQDREIYKIGQNNSIPVNIRVIAATNKNLEELILEKTFREDLYYRLNVIPINIPPLRERRSDISLLASFFIDKYSKILGKTVMKIENGIFEYLENYKWPGNVRELENTIEYMINMIDDNGVLDHNWIPAKIKGGVTNCEVGEIPIDEMEKAMIERALLVYGNSFMAKKEIASKLGIGIATLYRKIKKYDLE